MSYNRVAGYHLVQNYKGMPGGAGVADKGSPQLPAKLPMRFSFIERLVFVK